MYEMLVNILGRSWCHTDICYSGSELGARNRQPCYLRFSAMCIQLISLEDLFSLLALGFGPFKLPNGSPASSGALDVAARLKGSGLSSLPVFGEDPPTVLFPMVP
jgi:hypothetical protein